MSVRSDGKMTRTRIRAAGLHVALEKGWQGLTFKAVAEKLPDVSWQTVKHHYKTHGGLMAAVREHVEDMLTNDQFKRQHAKIMEQLAERLQELRDIELAA